MLPIPILNAYVVLSLSQISFLIIKFVFVSIVNLVFENCNWDNGKLFSFYSCVCCSGTSSTCELAVEDFSVI